MYNIIVILILKREYILKGIENNIGIMTTNIVRKTTDLCIIHKYNVSNPNIIYSFTV